MPKHSMAGIRSLGVATNTHKRVVGQALRKPLTSDPTDVRYATRRHSATSPAVIDKHLEHPWVGAQKPISGRASAWISGLEMESTVSRVSGIRSRRAGESRARPGCSLQGSFN